MRKLALFIALMIFHAGLSGPAQFENPFLFVVGAIACLAITALSARMGLVDEEGLPIERWAKTALYIPWLMWQIFVANIQVAKLVWNPDLPIAPRKIRVPHDLKTAYGVATYINSITLTPGTVTIDVTDGAFLVHVLTQEAADGVLDNVMHERVKKIEGRK